MITKEMIIENGWGFEEIIDNADDDELELIESCNGDLTMLLDNLQITGDIIEVQFLYKFLCFILKLNIRRDNNVCKSNRIRFR